jgi:hypothetical protein
MNFEKGDRFYSPRDKSWERIKKVSLNSYLGLKYLLVEERTHQTYWTTRKRLLENINESEIFFFKKPFICPLD